MFPFCLRPIIKAGSVLVALVEPGISQLFVQCTLWKNLSKDWIHKCLAMVALPWKYYLRHSSNSLTIRLKKCKAILLLLKLVPVLQIIRVAEHHMCILLMFLISSFEAPTVLYSSRRKCELRYIVGWIWNNDGGLLERNNDEFLHELSWEILLHLFWKN